ncbi:MAG: class I SAM-dependent methyltransferase [Deltaproteobacteria bacterium]|nr:class I SAM-dependent methyltransferase [Deltaproteobacteria bacterium]
MLDMSDAPNDPRKASLQKPEAQIFLSSLTPDILAKFKTCYVNADVQSAHAKEVLSYILKNSPIMQIVSKDTTSAHTFEYLYLRKDIESPLDKYFPNGRAAQAIYQRLHALKLNLPAIIRGEREKNNSASYKIVNIGSGPSHEMIEILLENPDLKDKVHITCVDPDREALIIGAQRVARLNLESHFSFVPAKYQTFDGRGYDMVLLIGILCPLNVRLCVRVMKNVKRCLRPGGIIIFSTVQNIMGQEDPLTDYIMRLTGWNMDYKEDHEPYAIARAAGCEPIGRFFDEYGYNCMTVARIK